MDEVVDIFDRGGDNENDRPSILSPTAAAWMDARSSSSCGSCLDGDSSSSLIDKGWSILPTGTGSTVLLPRLWDAAALDDGMAA